MRARTSFETDEDNGRVSIIVHELPYQVNKARLIEKIAELVREKRIEGIVGLRDESDKQGMRVVVEIKRGELPDVILNNLYAHTQMQTVFGMNMVALIDGQPGTLNLKEMLDCFLKHRREVVTRRSIFELEKARARAHILEGLAVALANIDEMIELIKQAKNPQEAKQNMMEKYWPLKNIGPILEKVRTNLPAHMSAEMNIDLSKGGYHLSAEQAQAILDLRLHRLTALEQEKIFGELDLLAQEMQRLLEILNSPVRLREVISTELKEAVAQFGDERRTEIIDSQEDLSLEDLISQEDVVVTLSHQGYVKLPIRTILYCVSQIMVVFTGLKFTNCQRPSALHEVAQLLIFCHSKKVRALMPCCQLKITTAGSLW